MEKPKYPTDNNGLPVIPDSTACYELCLKGVQDRNSHHLAWPRHEYTTSLERRYRNTACMVIKMCHCMHDDLHASYLPPEAPRRSVMDDVVNGHLAPMRAEDAGVELHIRSKAQINEDNLSEKARVLEHLRSLIEESYHGEE